MKKPLSPKIVAILGGLAFWYASNAQAILLVTNTIYSDNFDSDTVGSSPSGWSGATTANAFVTNSPSLSVPNSLQVNITDSTFFDAQTTFPGVDLFQFDQGLSYSLAINVKSIDANFGEGLRLSIINGISRLEVGSPRILRVGTQWSLYNQFNGQNVALGSFNTNQWYNFRVDISPSSKSDGTAFWYVDGVLIDTEPYSGKFLNQTTNVHVFEIFPVLDSDPNTHATVYFDNLVIQAIVPEPTSLALISASSALVWFGIRRNRGKEKKETRVMDASNRSKSETLRGLLLALCVAGLTATSSQAGLIFYDNFDSETVGSFPSTWTNVGSHAESGFVVSNFGPAPSTPNVFQVQHPVEDFFQVWRPFAATSLNTVSNVVINFSINVAQIPSGFSRGFVIVPGVLPTMGEETFSQMRVTSNTDGSSNTWAVINDYAVGSSGGNGLITNGLALNTWYNFRFEIDPSSTNAESGVVRWYIDNNLINTETHYVAPPGRTNINTLVVRNAAGAGAITTFYLDNVNVYTDLPEPSTATLVLLAGCGGSYFLRRRSRH